MSKERHLGERLKRFGKRLEVRHGLGKSEIRTIFNRTEEIHDAAKNIDKGIKEIFKAVLKQELKKKHKKHRKK